MYIYICVCVCVCDICTYAGICAVLARGEPLQSGLETVKLQMLGVAVSTPWLMW